MAIELKTVKIEKPADANAIIGQAHFIKSAEDLYEAIATSSAHARFGIAFSEASGDRLVRVEGNDAELKALAAKNALAMGAGHSFIILLKEAYPVNLLNALKAVPEVCCIHCATANELDVIIAEGESGRRGIAGVIDGEPPRGVEDEGAREARKALLRKFGYKL
jgi:adenosine/AMP kinase